MYIDTSILIYRGIDTSPHHQAVTALAEAEINKAVFTISRQVLREYLSATTRSGSKPAMISLAGSASDVRLFAEKFVVLEDGPEVWVQFEALRAMGGFAGKQIHDAYHVAIMLAHGETVLLTNHRSDFERFSSKIDIVSIQAYALSGAA
jgi:predicted nucleic acid-binding protein